MFEFLLLTPIIVLIFMILFLMFKFIKNNNTYKNRQIIIEAICEYKTNMIVSDKHMEIKVGYEDIEPYENTLYRWLDWGYENILPPDKFEIIKPYIKNNR